MIGQNNSFLQKYNAFPKFQYVFQTKVNFNSYLSSVIIVIFFRTEYYINVRPATDFFLFEMCTKKYKNKLLEWNYEYTPLHNMSSKVVHMPVIN